MATDGQEIGTGAGLTMRSSTDPVGMRALICEDEPLTVLLLERALQNAGVQVIGKAEEGELGVALADANQPDFILMDINMPGMNGIEATRRIMANRPVPIIMLTAYGDPEHVDEAIEAGACAYLVKPIAHAELIPAIQRALSLFRTCQELDEQYRTLTDRGAISRSA